MGYIDIHSHIIPGIDDGPRTIEESKIMLHNAFKEGFTTIIATPHCSKGFKKYTKEDVISQCALLNQYAKEQISSDLTVLPGQEIYYNEASLQLIRSSEVIPIAESKYILIEFAPNVSFSTLLRGLREVSMSPYDIVLAHVERYGCLRDFTKLIELREMGILIQMNYSDIGGKWYRMDTKWCRTCLKKGFVDFLGTDAHDDIFRTSGLQPALKWMHKHLDTDYVQRIMYLNARNAFIHKE